MNFFFNFFRFFQLFFSIFLLDFFCRFFYVKSMLTKAKLLIFFVFWRFNFLISAWLAPEPKFGNNELTVPCFASRHTLKTWKRSLDSCGRNMHAESDQIIWPLWPNCQLFAKRSFEVSLFIFHLCRFKKGKNYITSKFIQFFSHTSYMMMYITNIKLLVTLEKTRIVRVYRERSCEIYVL